MGWEVPAALYTGWVVPTNLKVGRVWGAVANGQYAIVTTYDDELLAIRVVHAVA